MVNYKFINIFSTILSIIIYLLVVFFVYFISKNDIKDFKDYGYDIKKSVIIKLDDIPSLKKNKELDEKESKPKSQSKKIEIKKISQNDKKETKQDSRDKIESNIKNLFSTMDVDKDANEIEQKLKKEKARASRLKKLHAKELFKSHTLDDSDLKKELLKIKNIVSDKKDSSKIKGRYDEKYLAKISSIITAKWQNTIATRDGLSATAVIRIDKNGRFIYKNLKKSFNNNFDTKLKRFLDNLTNQTFPKYTKGNYIEVELEFKDKEEF